MPKFQFSLETLLRHRDELEQRARDELFRLTYKYSVELRGRDELRAKFQETTKELSQRQSENAPTEELEWFHLYLNRLSLEIQEATKRVDQLESEVQAQKIVVIEASKNKKTLDLMKARKEKQFTFALEKQEQKQVDELVATRFSSKESRVENHETRRPRKAVK